MQLVCARCSRSLEYSGPRPSFCAYCGQALLPDTTLDTPSSAADAITQAPATIAPPRPAPPVVGGFRLGRQLGEGGMGSVFEAEEIATGRRVALKLIKPEYTRSVDAVERFRQEGRIASMVVHPRCVFVLAVDEDAGQPYIVMELMPGETLKELVGAQGALPAEQAIAKILDVIDGLQAAHRREVIHRDVKPSNCFLEADGRVKVGDFGLAKSLVQEGHLTKTGAFVGTPHFASPEQIRTEPIDARTDVYSVAATLYYLLTGKPPFFGSDTAATLARIVSDPPPPLRSLRPELSPALEAVVLRGLERDRERRYPDLDALRQALVRLTPERLTADGMLWRAGAGVIDLCLFGFVISRGVQAGLSTFASDDSVALRALRGSLNLALFAVYFLILERVFGGSAGKLLLGLRVCAGRSVDLPGWSAAAVRSVVFVAVVFGGMFVTLLVDERDHSLRELMGDAALVGGTILIASTMRPRNGYRGLHEVLSGTRTVRPARVQETARASAGWLLSFLHSRRLNQALTQTGPLPQRIAGFAIRGALTWTASDKVLLGEDASLGRRVFLWLRPMSAPALDAARRGVGRPTRLRWLSCGTQGELQWDAILAPQGWPLPEYIQSEGALGWREGRRLLHQLAGELAAAVADGTVPATLSVAQVWVTDDGRPQLADLPLTTAPDVERTDATPDAGGLRLLGRVAVLALEGQPRPVSAEPGRLRATLPADARRICERLIGIGATYASVEECHVELGRSTE
jgi:eukaryotic-like serine/threonine-protein kinase